MSVTEGALVAEALVVAGALGGWLLSVGISRYVNPWRGRRRRQ